MSAVEEKLQQLEWQFADLRGVRSVHANHSLLVESAKACETKFTLKILEDINEFGLSIEFDLSGKSPLYRFLYHHFLMNLQQVRDSPNSSMIFQEEFPLGVASGLEMHGMSKEEILGVFESAVRNLNENLMWDEYRKNVFVIESRDKGEKTFLCS